MVELSLEFFSFLEAGTLCGSVWRSFSLFAREPDRLFFPPPRAVLALEFFRSRRQPFDSQTPPNVPIFFRFPGRSRSLSDSPSVFPLPIPSSFSTCCSPWRCRLFWLANFFFFRIGGDLHPKKPSFIRLRRRLLDVGRMSLHVFAVDPPPTKNRVSLGP